MLLVSGCHNLPDRKMYWKTTPDTFVQAKSDLMPRNTMECILRNLLSDIEQLDE